MTAQKPRNHLRNLDEGRGEQNVVSWRRAVQRAYILIIRNDKYIYKILRFCGTILHRYNHIDVILLHHVMVLFIS